MRLTYHIPVLVPDSCSLTSNLSHSQFCSSDLPSNGYYYYSHKRRTAGKKKGPAPKGQPEVLVKHNRDRGAGNNPADNDGQKYYNPFGAHCLPPVRKRVGAEAPTSVLSKGQGLEESEVKNASLYNPCSHHVIPLRGFVSCIEGFTYAFLRVALDILDPVRPFCFAFHNQLHLYGGR